MTIKMFIQFLNNENLSEKYLLELQILKTFTKCPRCGSSHLGRIRRQRYKCYGCKFEWNIRKDSILEGRHMSLSEFIGCMKFFSDEMPASRCSEELEIYRVVTNELFNEFQNKLIGPIEKIKMHRGEIIIDIRFDPKTKTITIFQEKLKNTNNSKLKLFRSKDDYGSYCYKITYKNFKVKTFLKSIDRIDELDNFYRYCQERLLTFRGKDIKYLILKIHELVFRYNNRKEDILQILISRIKTKDPCKLI